jgi:hypothetical protein
MTHNADYSQFIKRFQLPPGYAAPVELVYQDLVIRAITRDDLDDDVRGINASLDLIRQTRGGRWPSEPVTSEGNYVDLVWHELEFREGDSFTYVVRRADGDYVGCAYLYPMGRRRPLSEELLPYDVDVSWWVTPEAYERGDYQQLYRALRHWLAAEFPFVAPFYSNAEIPDA